MRNHYFNITQHYPGHFRIETHNARYLVKMDNEKGTAIYMDFEGESPDILMKSYQGIKPLSAINYLYKREMIH